MIFAEATAAESIVEDGDLPVVFVGLLAFVTVMLLVILCAGDTKVSKVDHNDKGMIILVRMNITISYSINTNDHYIENNTCQNPYHMPYHPEKPISSRGPLGPRDDIGRG